MNDSPSLPGHSASRMWGEITSAALRSAWRVASGWVDLESARAAASQVIFEKLLWKDRENAASSLKTDAVDFFGFVESLVERASEIENPEERRSFIGLESYQNAETAQPVLSGAEEKILETASSLRAQKIMVWGFAGLIEKLGLDYAAEEIRNELSERLDGGLSEPILEELAKFRSRVSLLSPSLISSAREVHTEYLSWLKHNPHALDAIHWEAFEKIIAEVLSSHGFHVDITARLRNQSADLIAIRTDELGAQTRYLVECKRWSKGRPVGLDIVNQVIGAAARASVDHAFLVTSSVFTRDVEALRAELLDYRLNLRDGGQVMEWLREYEPREGYGLWLPQGWDEGMREE